MNTTLKSVACILLCAATPAGGPAPAQEKEIPEALEPWKDWVVWGAAHPDCPTPYNDAATHICFWPSRLSLSADQNGGAWDAAVTVFERTWVPLPGSGKIWPLEVRSDGEAIAVIDHNGRPFVELTAGVHELSGAFRWAEMPQQVAIPPQIGILSLVVEGEEVPIPNWDADGDVWLRRVRAEEADADFLAGQVYRVIEDGIPIWLRTEIELTVSGKSREEELGWILPEGWKLATVESPIPVAVDDLGHMKAQVRAGKWTIAVHAFSTTDVGEFRFATDAQPLVASELVAFRANPEFRVAEVQDIPQIDVNQTTFPGKWRNLPVYAWQTSGSFRLVEKMRGMGDRRPEGLSINRRLWLDEDGRGYTYQDNIQGNMQQIWRLDVAEGQDLGAVRVDGEGQLITANPQTGAPGVEIRDRNVNFEAVGRAAISGDLPATGWRADADSLRGTLTLPPGWRVFALFGADKVEGDWLTAWSLLDLFFLLIFALAVFRLWGVKAGLVALLAFGLAYHEPGSPRLTWFFLLMPIALLRVVGEGTIKRWIAVWKYVAAALLILSFVPFVARQVQSAIYPQLEAPGAMYADRNFFFQMGDTFDQVGYQVAYEGQPADMYPQSGAVPQVAASRESAAQIRDGVAINGAVSLGRLSSSANLRYDPSATIQTGPAEPQWNWNRVDFYWNGPVAAEQRVRPILISLPMGRVLTVVRLAFLFLLAAILFGVRRFPFPFGKRSVAVAVALIALASPSVSLAQFPDEAMLKDLRTRLLEPSDAYPNAADIPTVQLNVADNRLVMQAEIHAALSVAVPLPGRLPSWSPLSVTIDDDSDVVVRRDDGYLWVTVPPGVHRVAVEGLLPDAAEWEWTYLLKPRRVSIEAPGWTVAGVDPNGVPEPQVFFVREQQRSADEAAYDQEQFNPIVAVERRIEAGLIWKVHNVVRRLSAPGKAVSLKVPLLAGESTLTSNVVVENGLIEVRLGAAQSNFTWESELPVGGELRLTAGQTDQWVERWYLVTSPVWNVALSGLAPVFESQAESLIPAWSPWPGEEATLAFSRPEAVEGDTVTVQHVRHATSLNARRRTTTLELGLECSLANDFVITMNPDAEIESLTLDGQEIPVSHDGSKLTVPAHPGTQTVEVEWNTSELLKTVTQAEPLTFPVEAANVTTTIEVPENRWILWANGPLRGPAVRFWTILVCALLLALALGSLPLSPLGRTEWVLLALGLTQVHVAAAMLVVAWLLLLAWRGKLDPRPMSEWAFNLLQVAVVMLTFMALGVLIVIVGEGLLGSPEMFIIGNNSSRTFLQWFQPRAGTALPEPYLVSISFWYYRFLMLCWALWLANALLRWLKWGWNQFVSGGGWKKSAEQVPTATVVSDGSK